MSKHWTLDDIAWERFDPALVDPDMLATVKTASMVEGNAADYVVYLRNVFKGDDDFCKVVTTWGDEERQHGSALGRWAEMADPTFDYAKSLQQVQKSGYQLPLNVSESVRGSRMGELLSRCLVESATTSFYAAIADNANEPVLKQIAGFISADEVRHYTLFRRHLERYEAEQGRMGLLERVRVVAKRIGETEDDEFAYAYYATNVAGKGDDGYDQEKCAIAYESVALGYYQRPHANQGSKMILRAFGFKPGGWISRMIVPVLWLAMRWRQSSLQRRAASYS